MRVFLEKSGIAETADYRKSKLLSRLKDVYVSNEIIFTTF